MRSKLKRGMSLLLSAVMAISGAGNVKSVSAEEQMSEAAVVSETELTETEAPVYFITLPYYEECSYVFDKEHLKEPAEEKKEIVLAYEADEKVEISLVQTGTMEVEEVHLTDQERYEVPFVWNDENVLELTMPAKDIWLEMTFITPVTEIMQMETTAEPVQSEAVKMETEPVTELTTETYVEETGSMEPETECKESELPTELAENAVMVEGNPVIEVETTVKENLGTVITEQPEHETEEKEVVSSYQEETDTDGLPMQGSIVQVAVITIPFDTWEFDQYSDFRNIPYDTESCTIEYISDDIIYDVPGTYSSIYRVTDQESGKFWFVLRPVQVAEQKEEIAVIVDESETAGEMESEEETGLEEETESETVPNTYTVNVAQSSEYSYEFDHESMEYEAGEEVNFTIDLADTYSLLSLEAETGIAGAKDSNSDTEPVAIEQENANTYSFVMPEADVTISLEAESGVMLLAASDDDSPVPDKFKLIVKEIRYAPAALTNYLNGVAIAASTFKQVVFLDGDETVTRTAYCIQPKANTPGTGTIYDKDKAEELNSSDSDEKNMAKCLYYLYPGPAWGKTIDYSNGNGSVNLKTVMTNAGCTTKEDYYVLTHYVISYFYVGASDYNYNGSTGPALNSAGCKLVEDVVAYIKKLPIPRTKLNKTEVTATYDSDAGISQSETVYYNTLEENTATIKLPDGVTLVNETQGTTGTGKVTINGKDRFHLEASNVSGAATYNIECKFPVDFTAFKLGLSGMQDIGFSYYSGEKTLTLSITWPDVPSNGYAQVQKLDSETKTVQPLNSNYSLAGAEYTIYTDKAHTTEVAVLTTAEDGKSEAVELLEGTYYAQETKASTGYELDLEEYTLNVKAGETASFTSYEIPITKVIELQKKDKETGKEVPSNSAATFAGAEYAIYANAACTELIEVMKTDAKGYAKSSSLPVSTYYVKETAAPRGYLLDTTVHKIEMSLTDQVPVYTVTSAEPIIKKPIELQKVDKETGEAVPSNAAATFEGAEYTIYADAGCTEAVEVIKTDKNGYAKGSELQIGTYYVKETKAPYGYQKDETIHKVDMSYTDGLSVYRVTSKEQIIKKPIEVQKKDKESGLAKPQNSAVSFAGAEYTIYADQSCKEPVEVLKTNENGYAKSSDLVLGTYYIKETKAPIGYQPDTNLYTVTVGDDNKAVYRIESLEPVIRGSLSVMKFLDDSYEESVLQDRVESGILSGICFVLKHEDKTVPTVKIVTDKYGYASTDANALVYGTWYITEDPDTIPETNQTSSK